MGEIDISQAESEAARWHILCIIDAARPKGASETIIQTAIMPVVPMLQHQVRRELDYLEKRGLVSIERNEPVWYVEITRPGIDIVQYEADVEPGIARPKKYW